MDSLQLSKIAVALIDWQKGYPPLTCRNKKCTKEKLDPFINGIEPILKCPKCKHIQKDIPPCILGQLS
ncbi:hypothetical protein COB55_01285 [Candidatus Wolfebacteria bacterium]|nr:MAG: hypothetical protein COB55_01285 [Candidatus Wolfebacteria bacterium]